jgi:hypothetical protein
MTAASGRTDRDAEEPALASTDGRQSPRALAIARGALRTLLQLGLRGLPEVELANGRRADLMAVSEAGEIWIIEIKSSVEDFRSDQKWAEYRPFCDRLLFAVDREFPQDLIPADAGLIVADRFGGELLRRSAAHPLSAQRRKALMLRFARIAAGRLMSLADPGHRLDLPPRA